MPPSQFTPVWDALSAELRSRLLEHPGRRLTPADVDELAGAGERLVPVLWFDTRAGNPRGWATSWQFQRFIELYRLSETPRSGSVGNSIIGALLGAGRRSPTSR